MTTALIEPRITPLDREPASPFYTADELLTLQDGDRYELINGQLVEQQMGVLSSWVAGRIFHLLAAFIERLPGQFLAFPENTSFQCFPESNRVRRADTALLRDNPSTQASWSEGHLKIAPVLAVEVVSPHDTYNEVSRKIADWTAAGVLLLWVVDPESRMVVVHRKNSNTITCLSGDAEITGEDVLPGFVCRLSEFFPPAPNPTPATGPQAPAAQ